MRGGRIAAHICSFLRRIGESYFDYLAGLPDLVMLMDRFGIVIAPRAGMRAINELKPVLGIELTATPFVESPRGPVAFCNVIFDYPLAGRWRTASSRSPPSSLARTSIRPVNHPTPSRP